eukprot:3541839-Pleurochrysis_carterae.AAC.4
MCVRERCAPSSDESCKNLRVHFMSAGARVAKELADESSMAMRSTSPLLTCCSPSTSRGCSLCTRSTMDSEWEGAVVRPKPVTSQNIQLQQRGWLTRVATGSDFQRTLQVASVSTTTGIEDLTGNTCMSEWSNSAAYALRAVYTNWPFKHRFAQCHRCSSREALPSRTKIARTAALSLLALPVSSR